ncbi:MAG: hypothetical protein AABZ12_06725 [Planctomycetota bacterium]
MPARRRTPSSHAPLPARTLARRARTGFRRFGRSWIGFVSATAVWLVVTLPGCSKEEEKQPPDVVVLPTVYEEDRFFVVPEAENGEKVKFFTSTAGGLFIFADAAERISPATTKSDKPSGGKPTEGKSAEANPAAPVETSKPVDEKAAKTPVSELPAPKFKPGAWIPAPLPTEGVIPQVPSELRKQAGIAAEGVDGMLGDAWFAERVWTLDYPNRRLVLHGDGAYAVPEGANTVPLHFKMSDEGKRLSNYMRIDIGVAGAKLAVLLDTGATVIVTDEAVKSLDDGRPSVRATSYVVASVFDSWRKEHPDWRVIESAAQPAAEPIIEVPKVELGGEEIGPAWFVRTADDVYHDRISQVTDVQVNGAVGGNLLRHFRVILDYPKRLAIFEKPAGSAKPRRP